MRRHSSEKSDNGRAETLAIEALQFLAADVDRLQRFLATTGLGPQNLREAARDSNFLVSVLDHVCDDERLLLAFAEVASADPAGIVAARVKLGGRATAE